MNGDYAGDENALVGSTSGTGTISPAALVVMLVVGLAVGLIYSIPSIGTNAPATFVPTASNGLGEMQIEPRPTMAQLVMNEHAQQMHRSSDPTLAVQADPAQLLAHLARTFKTTENDISAKTIVTQKLLAQKGVHMTMLEIMSGLDTIATDAGSLGIRYEEVAAMFVSICGQAR